MLELNLDDFEANGANITCENGKVVTLKVGDPVRHNGNAGKIVGFSRLNDEGLIRWKRDGSTSDVWVYLAVTEVIDRNGNPV